MLSLSLSDNNQTDNIEAFNSTSGYLDDYSYGFLFNCTTVGQASDSMTALT